MTEPFEVKCINCGHPSVVQFPAPRAEPRAEGLDVERVGRIFHDRLDQSVLGHAGPVCQPCRQNAKAFAREYAVLEEPTNE